jgi:hypothetical protein
MNINHIRMPEPACSLKKVQGSAYIHRTVFHKVRYLQPFTDCMHTRESVPSTARGRDTGSWSAGSVLFWSVSGAAGVVTIASVAFRMASLKATRSNKHHSSHGPSANLNFLPGPRTSRFYPRHWAAVPSPVAAGSKGKTYFPVTVEFE